MTTKHVIDGLNPSKGSFYPNDALEISDILKNCHNEDPVIVPVGGGTRLQVGALLPRYDYALDLSKMNGIVTHNAADLTCIVQSGITLEHLQNILKELNGQRHQLISSVCISKNGSMMWNFTDASTLTMKKLNLDEIKSYLAKIRDKELYAYGVYQIEADGRSLFSKIEGDEDTIMGLPIKQIKEYLVTLK